MELQQQADQMNIPYWEHVITVMGKQETLIKLQRQEVRKVIEPVSPEEESLMLQEVFVGELLKPEGETDGSIENISQGGGNNANTTTTPKDLVNEGQEEGKMPTWTLTRIIM